MRSTPRERAPAADQRGCLHEGRPRCVPSYRSAAAWRSRFRARCAGWARWCGAGASCRSGAASSRRSGWRRAAFRSRRGWRAASPRSTAPGRRRRPAIDRARDSPEIFAAKPLASGATPGAPRSRLDAGQAAARGPDAFYKGEIADGDRRRRCARRGGVLDGRRSRALRDRRSRRRSRPAIAACGWRRCRRRRRAVVALIETLGILAARYPSGPAPAGETRGSAAQLHVLAEAFKHAFADRARYLGDTDFVTVDVRAPASPGYHAELARRIKPGAVLPRDAYGDAGAAARAAQGRAGRRTCRVIDAEGNAVALTTTMNLGFGAHLVAGKTGIVLNDEMDDFSLQPGVPNAFGLIGNEQNAVAPRKRPLSSMTPTIALDDGGRVRVVVGAAGGPTIITATAQVFMNVVDWKHGRAGGDRGAAHPPPVVSRAAGRRARDRRATRRPASATTARRSRRARTSARSTCWSRTDAGASRPRRNRAARANLRDTEAHEHARPKDHQGPDRQPGRDRVSRDPRLPRAGPAHGRRALRGRRGARCTCGWPTRRSRSGRRPRARATCAPRRSSTRSRRRAPTRFIPGYGFLSENADFAEARRGRGRDVHRAAARGDPRDGRQDLGARADAGGGRAGRAGRQRRGRAWVRDRRQRQGGRRAHRLSGDAQGGGGRRRPRHAPGRRRGEAGGRARRRAARGQGARSATTPSISRRRSSGRATSRSRCSATSTATPCTCSSATARSSGATRR